MSVITSESDLKSILKREVGSSAVSRTLQYKAVYPLTRKRGGHYSGYSYFTFSKNGKTVVFKIVYDNSGGVVLEWLRTFNRGATKKKNGISEMQYRAIEPFMSSGALLRSNLTVVLSSPPTEEQVLNALEAGYNDYTENFYYNSRLLTI